ncbi:MAG: SusD/RagB family nutrient-binding outer membrane lipoprotein [Bacteroidales bacterium]|nr:SusD/RagB family nutrient-binding outer membrane lipoprotein [Bacteroidales bacterium]
MKKIFSILFIVTLLTSCSEWLDINVDPNNPSEMKIDKILPSVFYDMGDDFGIGYSRLGYVCAVYVHQLTTRESYDQYGVTGSAYAITTYWNDLYTGMLQDLELLITLSTEDEAENLQYRGIAKILKAYVYSQMVDLWGDIPYTEANVSGLFTPVFDTDENIYPQLFTLLNEGIADLQNEEALNERVPGADDLIYGGDVDSWVKAANSIKLKLFNQVRLTTLYNQTEVSALLSGGELISSASESFLIPFGKSVSPDNRNPAFVAEYSGSQISNYLSPWFYEIMNGENDNIFTDLWDPRMPYYFANQVDEGLEPENPVEYRNGNFISIYFGSRGPNRDAGGRNTFSMMGIYPVGGAYDEDPELDKKKSFGIDAGTGAAPYKVLTYADVLYIQAELALTTTSGGDARALLEDAMEASFRQVDQVVTMTEAVGVPKLATHDTVDYYISRVLTDFDSGDAAKKLEIVMTQKWIAAFGSSIDSYTDYRRTGYPVMFDPNTMVADGGPDGNGVVPVQSSRDYPVAFPWSADELSLNKNAPGQKTISTDKVFWDIDN